MTRSATLATVRQKYEALASVLHEKARRRWAACEAQALGRGAITLVASATGLSRPTIRKGITELQAKATGDDTDTSDTSIRRQGGGRLPLTATDPVLLEHLKALVAPATRGDPMSPLLWTCKSTRNLAEALHAQGHTISHQTVARLLTE